MLSSTFRNARLVLRAAATRNFSTSRTWLEAGKRVVYIDNLPWSTHVLQLKSVAEPFGALTKINIPNTETGKPGGFANIEFADEHDAQKFFDTIGQHGLTVGGRQVRALLFENAQDVLHAETVNDTVYLNNFPEGTTEEDIRQTLASYGDITRINMAPRSGNGQIAFVQFSAPEAAAQVIEAAQQSRIQVNGLTPWVRYARPPRSREPREPNAKRTSRSEYLGTPNATVYIRQLPQGTTADDLTTALASYGEVVKTRFPAGYDSEICFVEFSSVEDATRVVRAGRDKQIQIHDKHPIIQYAKEKLAPIERPKRLHLSEFEGTEDDVRMMFKPYEQTMKGMFFFRNQGKIAAMLRFQSVEAAGTALQEIKQKGGDFIIDYAKVTHRKRNTESEMRNSYGGDWGGGSQNSHYPSRTPQ
ncbi:hypothetical protein VNI00_014545 [Paramarasmius palmivorus]|uniref:RRM domain-containing protein n=1 Tax=Paramarasmius palmivorus TaxID=297713 RepID=A0AAW0BSK6_9AGAR